MLRITIRSCLKTLRLIVEGRFQGAHVGELETRWLTTMPAADSLITVDLNGVTFIDCEGKQLLKRMNEQSAKLIATGTMTKQVSEGR